ncbi:Gfo/Idh/MocA family protein [Eubacterium multiforme]|uniref:Dehydrogenase n=1 Tax=Eubacterium multiforme TaxID=83339 RepID=A0ABT9UTC9_9FIRM|nr:Gfo/Idh/MocA family oxidoreductase [Eubacterium multiforme]MDQ0149544.1 putative dehydrogenase [Eubacterium multiforme]
MNKLKVCFVGIGSIAKRHIKNLYDICDEKNLNLQVDALRSKNGKFLDNIKYKISNVYYNENELPHDYDVIFITNPTDFHIDTLKRLHDKGKHFFIEKPLTSYKKLNKVFDIKYRHDSVYYVACPIRYTNVIQFLKKHINLSDVISVRCISSSYLPEWRPGIDYRNTYSSSKDLGGGVSIDLIHEWDYIQYLFGKPESIYYTCGKKSSLEIDCEDYAIYVAEYGEMVVELHLDYFGRKSLREIMIFTNHDTIVGDLIGSKVTFLKAGKVIDFSEERNDFQKNELRNFFCLIERNEKNINYIKEAYQTMNYTQGVIK